MIETLIIAWALTVIACLAVLLKKNSSRAFFWVGATMITGSVLTVIGLTTLVPTGLTAVQETATQLILITGGAVGANFIAHAFTSRSNA